MLYMAKDFISLFLTVFSFGTLFLYYFSFNRIPCSVLLFILSMQHRAATHACQASIRRSDRMLLLAFAIFFVVVRFSHSLLQFQFLHICTFISFFSSCLAFIAQLSLISLRARKPCVRLGTEDTLISHKSVLTLAVPNIHQRSSKANDC